MLLARHIAIPGLKAQVSTRLFSLSLPSLAGKSPLPAGSDTPFADLFLLESGRTGASSQEEADQQVREALEEIEKSREVLKPGGAPFEPSKVFAPENSAQFNYLTFIKKEREKDWHRQRYNPDLTEEQRSQADEISKLEIPLKNDKTMEYLASVIMRHGKKARARNTLNRALYLVHLKLRIDPVVALKDALDRMGPHAKLKRYSDGGARIEMVPRPLTERQRLRQAWDWILEASKRRSSRQFAVRLSEEIVAAIQGTSPGFEKKVAQHKLAVTNRAFISLMK